MSKHFSGRKGQDSSVSIFLVDFEMNFLQGD